MEHSFPDIGIVNRPPPAANPISSCRRLVQSWRLGVPLL